MEQRQQLTKRRTGAADHAECEIIVFWRWPGFRRRYPTEKHPMANPYDPPAGSQSPPAFAPRSMRATSYVLAAFAAVIGWQVLPQFVTSPLATWGWQNWWFGFAPAAYLLFAALVAVACERNAWRLGLISIPLVVAPLAIVTGLILFAIYLDFSNIAAGQYSWSQNAYNLLIVSLCPVVWYYLMASSIRSWRILRSSTRS